MTTNIQVEVFADLKHDFGLPQYETDGAAGMDVRANEQVTIRPGESKIVPTGLFMAIPRGFEIQVRPRSGLSYKTKLRISNSPGTIDSDYRNEVGVICENTGGEDIEFTLGDRIAQLVLSRVPLIGWARVASKGDLGKTTRTGGFGSTGGVDGAGMKPTALSSEFVSGGIPSGTINVFMGGREGGKSVFADAIKKVVPGSGPRSARSLGG